MRLKKVFALMSAAVFTVSVNLSPAFAIDPLPEDPTGPRPVDPNVPYFPPTPTPTNPNPIQDPLGLPVPPKTGGPMGKNADSSGSFQLNSTQMSAPFCKSELLLAASSLKEALSSPNAGKPGGAPSPENKEKISNLISYFNSLSVSCKGFYP